MKVCDKAGFPVSIPYAQDFLGDHDNNLVLAMKAIKMDLDSRELDVLIFS